MSHWILDPVTVQLFTTKLDLGHITLKYAKSYFSAYGCEIKGRTKEQFIKNMIALSKEK